jgi:hypothetical protein
VWEKAKEKALEVTFAEDPKWRCDICSTFGARKSTLSQNST